MPICKLPGQEEAASLSAAPAAPVPVGIFITKGLRIAVPVGGLQVRVADDGTVSADCALHLHYDVVPTWLELAISHLLTAEEHWNAVRAVWDIPGKQDEAAAALEREFAAGMQAATSAAIAVDALYGAVKERIALPEGLVKRWRKHKLARYRQIAEVLRRGFLVGPRSANQLRAVLHDLMRFRDQAVHPSGALSSPHHHPELDRAMEWRFVTFRFAVVRVLVTLAVGAVAQLAFCPNPKHVALVRYCADLSPKVVPLLYRLERRFGRAFERGVDHKGPPEEGAGSQAE